MFVKDAAKIDVLAFMVDASDPDKIPQVMFLLICFQTFWFSKLCCFSGRGRAAALCESSGRLKAGYCTGEQVRCAPSAVGQPGGRKAALEGVVREEEDAVVVPER